MQAVSPLKSFPSFRDFKIIIFLLNLLILDILHNYFVYHISRGSREISTRPQMPAPKQPRQGFEFTQHLPGTLPLQGLHQIAYNQKWRNRHKQMDMILRYMSRQYFHILVPAYLSEKLSATMRYLTAQYWFTVLRNPNQVIFEILNRGGSLPIVLHEPKIPPALIKLKSSPKGEGFSPITRLRH